MFDFHRNQNDLVVFPFNLMDRFRRPQRHRLIQDVGRTLGLSRRHTEPSVRLNTQEAVRNLEAGEDTRPSEISTIQQRLAGLLGRRRSSAVPPPQQQPEPQRPAAVKRTESAPLPPRQQPAVASSSRPMVSVKETESVPSDLPSQQEPAAPVSTAAAATTARPNLITRNTDDSFTTPIEDITTMESLEAETAPPSSRSSIDGGDRPVQPMPNIEDVISTYETSVRSLINDSSSYAPVPATANHDSDETNYFNDAVASGDESQSQMDESQSDDIFSPESRPETPGTPVSEHNLDDDEYDEKMILELDLDTAAAVAFAGVHERHIPGSMTHESIAEEPVPVYEPVAEPIIPNAPVVVETELPSPVSKLQITMEAAPVRPTPTRPGLTREKSSFKSVPYKKPGTPKVAPKRKNGWKKVPKKFAGSPRLRRKALSRPFW